MHYSDAQNEILIKGRRTGVTLDQRPLDINGMEEITGIFSSPRKPSPLKQMTLIPSVEESSMLPNRAEMFSMNIGLMALQILDARPAKHHPRESRQEDSQSPRLDHHLPRKVEFRVQQGKAMVWTSLRAKVWNRNQNHRILRMSKIPP